MEAKICNNFFSGGLDKLISKIHLLAYVIRDYVADRRVLEVL